jgi:putative heme iron utilization protein
MDFKIEQQGKGFIRLFNQEMDKAIMTYLQRVEEKEILKQSVKKFKQRKKK